MGVELGLPRAKAFMACHAGDTNSMFPLLPSHLQSPAKMPDLLMLVIVGADDHVAGDTTGRQLFTESTGVKPAHKNLIIVPSDCHGSPSLVSNHFAPLAAVKAYATGARELQSGQTGYRAKLDLGHGLVPLFNVFRHQHRLVHAVFGAIGRRVTWSSLDPELAAWLRAHPDRDAAADAGQ